MAKPRIKIDHSQCECVIKERGPHWGLFCEPHDHWIKWLTEREMDVLTGLNIPLISDSAAKGKRLQDLPLFKFGDDRGQSL